MDNSLKGLILAAGVIITCIVVGLGFFISREAKNASDTGTNQLSAMSSQFNNVEYTMYNGLKVTGSEVVNVIKSHAGKIQVSVITKANTAGKTYISKDINPYNISDENYINPSALFLGQLIRNSNEEVTEIVFTQQ